MDNGIFLEVTAAYSYSQNGIAERGNRTVVSEACAMLHSQDPHLAYYLWPEAVKYATYLRNHSLSHALRDNKTPDEVFWNKKPNIANLQEFSHICWVLQQDKKNKKLDPRSRPFIFVGIDDSTKGYCYWNGNQILTLCNVIFSKEDTEICDYDDVEVPINRPMEIEGENDEQINPPSDDKLPDENISTKNSTTKETPKPSKIPLPMQEKSTCIAKKSPFHYRFLNNPAARGPKEWQHQVPVLTEEESNFVQNMETYDYAIFAQKAPNANDDLRDVKEARSHQDWPEWKKAMDTEIHQLENLGTYIKVKIPKDRVAINCKWVFHLKRDAESKIVRHKARLVAKGFSQIPRIDFFETFVPVMRLNTLQLLLAIATTYGLVTHIVDIVEAYLNGELKEQIYMKQIPGYEDGTDSVLLLQRTLYGLQQSGRIWSEKLNKAFIQLGFTRLFSDQCVYIRHIRNNVVIIRVHVDDMLVLASDNEAMAEFKKKFSHKFDISDLGELKQIVGFAIQRDLTKGTINLTQTQYVGKILDRFGMSKSAPVKMPMDPHVKLTKTPKVEHHNIPEYAAEIGSLMQQLARSLTLCMLSNI